MTSFVDPFASLNAAQRRAVDTIEGPLLVLAGPGTGKTQLLSARVANILQSTDTLPQNVLCLTFTESGAENMRERLTRFIGQAAYDVTISTYHGFGSDIIYRFPQYFTATQLQNPVDQLGKHEILRAIIDDLSYLNPLKQLQHHLGDLISTISEVKRALLTPDDLRAIAKENRQFVSKASHQAREALDALSLQSRLSKQSIPLFADILGIIATLEPSAPAGPEYGTLCTLATSSLESALTETTESGKTTPLTAWKNKWLAKNEENRYIFAGDLENRRIAALADVFELYETALARQGLYDFDDMIARAIEAMERHPDLKYTLQEQYLYILLDEFQDTNAAQLRLVELLTDNPVNEGRPNVMAVGDDDQAIYAFQGAQYSNMVDYYNLYQNVQIISLTQNYRSHADIIGTSTNVAQQISARLSDKFEGVSKQLEAAMQDTTSATIVRMELASDVGQYDWIAHQIQQLIQSGSPAREIAVLAPKHRYLEPLVAYLNHHDIPVQYEKRENVLDAPIVKQLLNMSRLVLALRDANFKLADALWPEILSYDFWQIPVRNIWELSWKIHDGNKDESNWTRALLDEASCATPAKLFTALALRCNTETCEALLDYLIGTVPVKVHDDGTEEVRSPLRAYYTSPEVQQDHPELFYETITQLKVLQGKLREHQTATNRTLLLADLLEFVHMYEAAGEQMLNTSPYHQRADAVQLMTVFKAKGLEFEHVFLPSCHDDVWGGGSRGSKNNLTLPDNLSPIRHAGATDNERLRILFVAITRAKRGLYLTSYSHTFSGQATKRLKYLNEVEQADGTFATAILPPAFQTVQTDGHDAPTLEVLELDWRTRHYANLFSPDIKDLLGQRLKHYQLSPTHLNQFIDLVHAGPQEFAFRTLLRFPQAPTVSGQYGNAIHETLEWLQYQVDANNDMPALAETLQHFAARLKTKKLTDQELTLHLERGEQALTAYLTQKGSQFKPGDKAEYNFAREGVFVGNAHMTGKIDRMEVDTANKRITVVDYKTGRPRQKWLSTDLALHKYRQQLYCYKLLIEGSHTFAGYTVTDARLEFIEPDTAGHIYSLPLVFDAKELEQTKRLTNAVWQHITTLDLPDTASYSTDVRGVLEFEATLLEEQK